MKCNTIYNIPLWLQFCFDQVNSLKGKKIYAHTKVKETRFLTGNHLYLTFYKLYLKYPKYDFLLARHRHRHFRVLLMYVFQIEKEKAKKKKMKQLHKKVAVLVLTHEVAVGSDSKPC